MSVPYWIQDAIFYQIFPDRFANADLNIDPPNVLPWNALPTERGFFGGDFRGIIEKFDYLLDLGINAIYLNPIFLSASIHRYNITDYMRIDPRLGDLADFHALIELAHRNDVRVILDGVFNHCGRGFFAFNDLLENQADSPYKDWFHVKKFPIDAYSPGDAEEYIGWWNLKSMPKFNTGNLAVRRYLLDVARYWIEQGADGWRLDVPNEIDDDTFWAEFRHTVRQANRDAYLLGEIWDVNPRWVGAEHFDGLMNYPFREALFSFLMEKNKASQFASNLDRLLKAYPRQNLYAMFLPLGTHDTERVYQLLGGNQKKVQLAFMFQFAFPGAPSIYYGDEIGLDGGKDPDNRRPFPWDQKQWKSDLRALVQHLAAERRRLPALRRGDFQSLFVDDRRGVFVFARRLGSETVIVALNASATRRSFYLPVDALGIKDGHILRDLIGGGELIVSESSLSINLPAWSGLWLG
jgi:cyclomaltodextrinase